MSEPAQAASAARSPQETARSPAIMLTVSGVITIAFALVAGLVIEPFLFAVALVGIGDFVLAKLFASGRIGPLAQRRRAAASGDAAAIAERDPGFNPYARED